MALHGEVLINYSRLEESVSRLCSYLESLNRIESVIDSNSGLLSDQQGTPFEALEERRAALKEALAEQREAAQDLRDSLSNYTNDMEALIHPMARADAVRVRPYDIGLNLWQIKYFAGLVFSPNIYPPSQTNPYLEWVPGDGESSGYYKSDEDRIEREVRNGMKVDGFLGDRLPGIKSRIDTCIDNLYDIHENKVKAFKEMDDYHAGLAKQLYKKHTSAKERWVDQRQKDAQAVIDFGRGAWAGIKGIGIGIFGLAKSGVAAVVTNECERLGAEPPEWASESVKGVKDGFEKFLEDPLAFFANFGQDFCDTYEDEGLAYVAGSLTVEVASFVVGPEVLITKLGPMMKAGKIIKARKVVDEAVDVSKGLNKVDDLVEGSTKTGQKMVTDSNINSVKEFINGTKPFNDVLDDYAKMYTDIIQSGKKTWSWREDIPGSDLLTLKQKKLIKDTSISKGYLPNVIVKETEGMKFGVADFKSAGLVKHEIDLPKDLWKASDTKQFEWLDKQIGGSIDGYTWHHTEIPGKMQLVPYGIHDIITHNGGRTKGLWADAPR